MYRERLEFFVEHTHKVLEEVESLLLGISTIRGKYSTLNCVADLLGNLSKLAKCLGLNETVHLISAVQDFLHHIKADPRLLDGPSFMQIYESCHCILTLSSEQLEKGFISTKTESERIKLIEHMAFSCSPYTYGTRTELSNC